MNTAEATIPQFVFDKLDRHPDAVALTAWVSEAWREFSWRQLAGEVFQRTQRLLQGGIEPGHRVLLAGANQVGWPIMDLALQCVGAVSVPLSPLLTPAQVGQLAEHSGAVLACLDSEAANRFGPAVDQQGIPVWRLDEPAHSDVLATDQDFDGLRQLAARRAQPDALLSILYTSGTTGEPKGVMLTQANLAQNAIAKVSALPLRPDDVRLAWLPMAHIFSRLADLFTAWLTGCSTVISRGRDQLFEEFRQFRPTYLNGVPWLFEKCHRLLHAAGKLEEPGVLQELLGGRVRVCNCGGAPLAPHVLEWFARQAVPLVCGYGLTEAAPVVTACDVHEYRAGSVGKALPGTELRLAKDGEIEFRGPNVMPGYWRDPETTGETVVDGWLRTGDYGRLDEDGFLFITGRKKDLLVTSTGRNIAPAPIEARLLADPWISQCLVVGDGLPFLLALIVPDPAECPVRECGSGDGDLASRMMERIHKRLSDRPAYELPASVILVARPFTVENGLATPKQSLRRSAIVACYSRQIQAEADRLLSHRRE